MSKQGWISIHRSIQDNWIWKDEPFSKGQAWIDILLMANFKDNKFLLGTELVTVDSGSFITSEKKLMERWMWSNTKVRNFLKLLESDGMITRITDSKKSTITVVNYKAYQDSEKCEESAEKEKYRQDQKIIENKINENGKKRSGSNTHENKVYEEIEKREKSAKEVREKCLKSDKEVREHTNNKVNTVNTVNTVNKKPTGFSVIIDNYTTDQNLKNTILDFVEMRKKNKKNMTERALELLLKELDKMANDDLIKQQILNQSIANCWQGIFPLKNQQKEENTGYEYNNTFDPADSL